MCGLRDRVPAAGSHSAWAFMPDAAHAPTLVSTAAGMVHGVCFWFELVLDENDPTNKLSTGPGPPCTGAGGDLIAPSWRDHWQPCVRFAPAPIPVHVGQSLALLCWHDDFAIWFDFATLFPAAGLGSPARAPPPTCSCSHHAQYSPAQLARQGDVHLWRAIGAAWSSAWPAAPSSLTVRVPPTPFARSFQMAISAVSDARVHLLAWDDPLVHAGLPVTPGPAVTTAAIVVGDWLATDNAWPWQGLSLAWSLHDAHTVVWPASVHLWAQVVSLPELSLRFATVSPQEGIDLQPYNCARNTTSGFACRYPLAQCRVVELSPPRILTELVPAPRGKLTDTGALELTEPVAAAVPHALVLWVEPSGGAWSRPSRSPCPWQESTLLVLPQPWHAGRSVQWHLGGDGPTDWCMLAHAVP